MSAETESALEKSTTENQEPPIDVRSSIVGAVKELRDDDGYNTQDTNISSLDDDKPFTDEDQPTDVRSSIKEAIYELAEEELGKHPELNNVSDEDRKEILPELIEFAKSHPELNRALPGMRKLLSSGKIPRTGKRQYGGFDLERAYQRVIKNLNKPKRSEVNSPESVRQSILDVLAAR